jgi:chemotaxis-related protein WspD
MAESIQLLQNSQATQPIDACWSRIGVQGSRTCERLAEYIHCRNCPVHAAAAISLLDRYSLQREEGDSALAEAIQASGEERLLMIFRLGEQWLGLAARSLVEVALQAPIHSLPHQRSRALLGVANVRGTLVACISLAHLLGLEAGPAVKVERRIVPRMLVLAGQGGPLVAPVDEVDGIHDVPLQVIREAGQGSAQSANRFASGVMQWQGRSITLLDEQLLQQAIRRSLA